MLSQRTDLPLKFTQNNVSMLWHVQVLIFRQYTVQVDLQSCLGQIGRFSRKHGDKIPWYVVGKGNDYAKLVHISTSTVGPGTTLDN